MNFELSLGEAIDKLNILELKEKNIKDQSYLFEIKKEINALNSLNNHKTNDYYKILSYINEQIWDLTNKIKGEISDELFNKTAKEIFNLNQKRFRIKKIFNQYSNLKEQKSYNLTFCKVEVNFDVNKFIPELMWLSIEYDYVIFDKDLKDIFNTSNFIHIDKSIIYLTDNFNWEFYVSFYKDLPAAGITTEQSAWGHWDTYGRNEKRKCNMVLTTFENPTGITININDILLSDELKDIFDFVPINYCSGGLLGDFIHNLSVINEIYIKTCRKGNLYLQNGCGNPHDFIQGHAFSLGETFTFNDTYPVISKQPYIKNFNLFGNEIIDVNLNTWRINPVMINWYINFKKYFDVEWGTHKWLTVPNDSVWNNRVLINTTIYGFPYDFGFGQMLNEQGISQRINFQELVNLYGESLIFIAMEIHSYNYFIERTGLTCIPFYKVSSFTELTIILNSCKKIYGSFSAPLAVAGALHKERFPPLI